ncbi:ankyrin repeat domain-containing protein [Nitratifractor sp.]
MSKYGWIGLVLLLFAATLNASDKDVPLVSAVDRRDFAEVVRLVESGVDIDRKNGNGFTALLLAAGWGDLRTVKYLIEHGASLDVRGNLGFGVIHRAAMNKDPSVLRYLLDRYDPDLNDRGEHYCSPLDYALRYNALQKGGTLENARLLLRRGAAESINEKCNGYAPLMISYTDKKVVELLLRNGADKSVKNRAGMTAYDMAKRAHAPKEILEVLAPDRKEEKREDRLFFRKAGLFWELKTERNKHEQLTEAQARDYCEKLSLGGYTDWRIPPLKEYSTILLGKPIEGFVIDGIPRYYLDPKEFPHLSPSRYWALDEEGKIRYLDLSSKRSGEICRSCEKNLIRCVRGERKPGSSVGR